MEPLNDVLLGYLLVNPGLQRGIEKEEEEEEEDDDDDDSISIYLCLVTVNICRF